MNHVVHVTHMNPVPHVIHVTHAGQSEASFMIQQQQLLQQLQKQEQTAKAQVKMAETTRAEAQQALLQAQQEISRSADHLTHFNNYKVQEDHRLLHKSNLLTCIVFDLFCYCLLLLCI